MRKLVLVHGRSQEGKDPDELKWTWVNALVSGLQKSGLELPVDYDSIAFPYYGDLLDQLIYGAEGEGDVQVITRGVPQDEDELKFKGQLMQAFAERANISDDQIREAIGDPTIQRSPFNWEWVQGIMRAFDQYVPAVSGTALNLFTHDVYVYLKRPGVRDEVDKLVRSFIANEEECVVVGHSLGSVVTFSVLRRDEAFLNVPLYVTIGSPLGLELIQNAFHPVDTPTCVAGWHNAMDPKDFVALYPLEAPHFVVSPEVENNKNVDNFVRNHHGIVGYLTDENVARRIYEGITS